MNVGSLLTNSANKYPQRLAIISEEGRWPYKAFDQRTNQLAGSMRKAGLKKGNRVGILFFTSSYFTEVYFAAVKTGLVATPINFRLTGPEISHILNDSQPGILFYGPEFETTLDSIQGQLEKPPLLVSPRRDSASAAQNYQKRR